MVYRKRIVRARRPKRFHKKAVNRKRALVNFTRSPSAVADSTFVKLRYSTTVTTTSTGTPISHVFQTSLNDPDYSGGGHQPLGRDQWTAFYQRYRCFGMKYECIAVNTNTSVQADCCVIQKPTTAAVTTSDQFWEIPYSQPKILNIEGAGGSSRLFKGYMSVAKVQGCTKRRVAMDDVFQAAQTANPAVMAYLHVSSFADDLATSVTVRWRVRLTYYVKLFDRVTLATS